MALKTRQQIWNIIQKWWPGNEGKALYEIATQVNELEESISTDSVAGHVSAADPHTNYVQENFTGPSTAFDLLKINLPDLTDATEAQLEWRQSFANVPQADANNRVMKMGYFRTGSDPEGPGAWWLAMEPFYQVGVDAHNWKEFHLEFVARNDTQNRMLSGWVDIGPNTHAGGIVDSLWMNRFHDNWFINVSTDTVTAKIGGTDGAATFLSNWLSFAISGNRRSINFGPAGGVFELAGVDSTAPTTRTFGPFTWFSGANLIDTSAADIRLQIRRVDYATPSGNIVAFSRGDHSSHKFAATDIFGTIQGGIRNDGSLHVVPIAVASLPTPTVALGGTRHVVNNSSVAMSGNFGTIVAGGGSNIVPVICDTVNWRIG